MISAGFGLRIGDVILVEPRASWAGAGRRASALVAALLPTDTRVEHVGSTSVPGLRAKPILDLVAGFASPIQIGSLCTSLTPLDIRLADDLSDDGGVLFHFAVAPNSIGLHLHCVTTDDPQWTSYLTLRRELRRNEDLRNRYAGHKANLAGLNVGDRDGYTKGKAAFIRAALEAAA